MIDWFQQKWGHSEEVPIDDIYDRIVELEKNYHNALENIKRLEEENIETSNLLYEIMNSVEAVDAMIDIIAEHCGVNQNV